MDTTLRDELMKLGMERFFKIAAAPVGAASKWLRSGKGLHTTELLGLGTLAAPSVAHLAGHDMNENTKSVMEVGGLGTLAAPSVAHMLKGMRKR